MGYCSGEGTRLCRIFHYRSVWVREHSSDWWHHVVNRTWTADDWHKETLNHICDELAPEISWQNTRFWRATPTRQRVAVALWSIKQSATYLTLEYLRLVVLCRIFLEPLIKLFFQYTLNCPKESALMKLHIRGFERITITITM